MAAFDPVAFAMGKAGASRDLVSALMGGNGGGGGSGTLETSGWVKELNGGATVSGNTIDLPKNSLSVSALIAPPDSAFAEGDVLEISVTVNSRSSYIRIDVNNSAATFSGPKTVWKVRSGCNVQASATGGPEVLTWTFTGDSSQLTFRACNGSGSQYSNTGNLSITGIKFNGTVVYGTVGGG